MNLANTSSNLVPLEYALRYIPDAPALHKALLRNQLFVPPLKDAMCTKDFLVGILEKRYWVPLTSDIQVRNCADVPSKKDMALILHEAMMGCLESVDTEIRAGFAATANLLAKHPPSVTWSLMMVSTVNNGHPIFAKDWQKPRAPAASVISQHQTLVPAFGDFFDGLPVEQRTKRAGKITFVSKQQQQALRVQKLEVQLGKARAKLHEESKEVNSMPISAHVTAFHNPIQSVHSHSHSQGQVPAEQQLGQPRPMMVTTNCTNVIGNA